MKFLRNLVFLGLLVGLMAATSDRALPPVVEQQLKCGGKTWTNNELIGYDNGNAVTIKIMFNRIYPWKQGAIASNQVINVARDSNGNRRTDLFDIWYDCVNPPDPDTEGRNYIGAMTVVPNSNPVKYGIPCNGKLIPENTWMSYINGGSFPGGKAYSIAKIYKGQLRGHIVFTDGSVPSTSLLNTDPSTITFNMLQIEGGTNLGQYNKDIFSNPATAGKYLPLTADEINGCFWKDNTNFPDCFVAPALGTVSNTSQTALSATFTGFLDKYVGQENAFKTMSWTIKPSVANTANERSGDVSVTTASFNLTYSSLPPGSYTLRIKGGDCISAESSKTFTISDKPACSSNPVVGTISSISSTGLTFSFTASNTTTLPNLTWRIKPVVSNSANERTGKTSGANTSGESITYATLPAGDYTLEIEGGDCASSVNSKAFSIPKPNCVGLPTISSISSIGATSLVVNFSGAVPSYKLDWKIKDASGFVVALGTTATLTTASTTLSFARLGNANGYSLEMIGNDCVSTALVKSFDINVADTRPTCDSGPALREVYNTSFTGLTFNFAGSGVGSIDWRILNGNGTVVLYSNSQSFVPQNDRPSVSFTYLPEANYMLQIQGGTTCKSTPSTMAFKIGNPAPLPIYVANFDGQARKDGINLSWTVVAEKNGQGFEILRYNDQAKTPQVIASIPLSDSKIGNYSYLDQNPANGNNYYQLKQNDLDGSSTTGRIIAVKFEQLYDMFIAPNPAKDYVDVEFESRAEGVATFETYSTAGIRVANSRQKLKAGNNRVRLNVSGFAEGNYILKIQNGEQSKSMRFLKLR
jgi:hypothetical protein